MESELSSMLKGLGHEEEEFVHFAYKVARTQAVTDQMNLLKEYRVSSVHVLWRVAKLLKKYKSLEVVSALIHYPATPVELLGDLAIPGNTCFIGGLPLHLNRVLATHAHRLPSLMSTLFARHEPSIDEALMMNQDLNGGFVSGFYERYIIRQKDYSKINFIFAHASTSHGLRIDHVKDCQEFIVNAYATGLSKSWYLPCATEWIIGVTKHANTDKIKEVLPALLVLVLQEQKNLPKEFISLMAEHPLYTVRHAARCAAVPINLEIKVRLFDQIRTLLMFELFGH